MTRAAVLIVPGPIDAVSGGYGYDRRIMAGLRTRGWSIDVRELDPSFPRPTAEALDAAAHVLQDIPDEALVLIDGLALGAMPVQARREAARLRLIGLVHHPLAMESGLDPETAAAFEASERQALSAVRLVIVTSRGTARMLDRYGVTQDVVVAEPGTDRAPVARGSRDGVVHLLSVASVIPRKGYDVLLRALAGVRPRNWRLTVVGSLDRDPQLVTRLRNQLHADGLGDRVTFAGEVEESAVAPYYDDADVFVLSTLHEGYGMAVAEALARGLPVVSTPTGAIHELVEHDRAGFLVSSGDAHALADTLSKVIADPSVRTRLARGARRVRDRLPSWDDCSDRIAGALERVLTDGPLYR